ncbi:MAG: hypothetical protein V1750_03925 [Acidobacteriota bacterium]
MRTSDDRTYPLDAKRALDLVINPLESYRAVERLEVFGGAGCP